MPKGWNGIEAGERTDPILDEPPEAPVSWMPADGNTGPGRPREAVAWSRPVWSSGLSSSSPVSASRILISVPRRIRETPPRAPGAPARVPMKKELVPAMVGLRGAGPRGFRSPPTPGLGPRPRPRSGAPQKGLLKMEKERPLSRADGVFRPCLYPSPKARGQARRGRPLKVIRRKAVRRYPRSPE